MRRRRAVAALALLVALAVPAGRALAQGRDFSKVQITPTPLRGGLTMLAGAGGNLLVSTGDDGTLVVDSQFAPLAPKIQDAIHALSPTPIRLLINTHFHGDHTGGNVAMHDAGAIIVAQDNVRKRMTRDQFNAVFQDTMRAAKPAAWPVITFADSLTFHWNGQTIRVLHVKPAHTDGDAVLLFPDANVVHMGDCFFNGLYPVIDVSSGGSIEGMIAADDDVLAMVNADTHIIPGHGPLGDAKSLRAFRDMLATARDRVKPLVVAGKSLKDIVAAKPLAELDAQWSHGMFKTDEWVELLYMDFTEHSKK